MGVAEDLADALARDALALEGDLDDERLIDQLSIVLGASSQTIQEAFMTSVRVRRAEARGRKFLAEKRDKLPPKP